MGIIHKETRVFVDKVIQMCTVKVIAYMLFFLFNKTIQMCLIKEVDLE